MGEYADMAIEEEMLSELYDLMNQTEAGRPSKPKPITKQNFVWVDVNGGKHKLKDIDNYYLANIIGFVKRKHNSSYNKLIEFLETEQFNRLRPKKSFVDKILRR
jgi:hypothetical protein